ncbi:uncharacterized protein A1O9_09943 [Exophiala aquamarina CBS 119918]|uniref:Major facilitator superfamily (MFS) profile domain-containing protein n=1 Tax=Exophiala aquamarina CBS 119918 TaxID=1182545 RepID=A0A072P4G0_9EURO|nr:uncharacterized protein A1O9_09943 [Exophiala aquamarina CBS 119918]KEF54148.1 hypothetical protein A1O9_09943 [Exophiala aquamarina CBS 119918]
MEALELQRSRASGNDSRRSSIEGPVLSDHDTIESQLPPADQGKDAWLFLTSCFFLEALIWGFAFSFGVFQDYYSTHEPFAREGKIAIIGTTATGIIYISAPIVFGLLLSYPHLKRWSCLSGLIIMCLWIGLSSFSRTTSDLILSQGVAYAVGAGLAYAPTILFLDEWFVRRKGLAYGIMWAGTGVSGIVLPILMQWLLNSHGPRTALRTWAVALFICTAPLIYFVKPRLPISHAFRVKRFDLSFVWNKVFVVYQVCNIVEALGFFLPQTYLPSYARIVGADNVTATLTLVLVNVASVFGCIVMGTLTDRYHVTTCILICTMGVVLGTFLIWGFSTTIGPLYVFCIVYGFFAGSFSSTWPGVIRETQKQKRAADLGMVFGFLAAGRGIGNVVSGPLSEVLLAGNPWRNPANFAYGSRYGPLIVFTGVTALLGGLSIIARPLKLV